MAVALLWVGGMSGQVAASGADVSVRRTGAAESNEGAQGGTIAGRVVAGAVGKAGGVPLPGVAMTAMNTLSGKKYATSTDMDGRYAMEIPRNGRYVVRAELTGFAPVTHEVVLHGVEAEAAKQSITIMPETTDFSLELASRVAANEAKQSVASSGAAVLRGLQGLSLSAGADAMDASKVGGNQGVTLPTIAGMDDASESVAVNGQPGQTNGLANFSEEEIRQRVAEAVARGQASGMIPQGGNPTNAIVGMLSGMMGGPGPGGPRGGRGGFGGAFRNFNPAQPHGSIFYETSNGALDSAQWSPDLLPQVKPSSYTNKYGVTIAASPYIPGLTKPNTKQFMFLNVTGQKNLNAFLGGPSRVPTSLERTGDFSQSTQVVNGAATPVTIYDPVTGLAVRDNNLANAATPISKEALALLQYYPAPNIPTNAEGFNYETISNAGNNVIALNTRYIRTLGHSTGMPFGGFGRRGAGNGPPSLQQNMNVGYNYSHSASDLRNIFLPLGGASSTDGDALNVGYTVSYGRLSNHSTLTWNRLNTETRNYFTDTSNDPTTTAGITIPNLSGGFADPRFYNGLPTLNITNFASLTNTTPNELINQTISFSDFAAYRHAKHNVRLGLDVRRVHADSIGGDDPLGQFTFSGFATESPADKASSNGASLSGSGFADFLFGLPQSTAIQAGLYKTYLRENVYDWFATDDFRVKPNLTLNYGVRYEYFAPYTEKNNRLVNLDHNANFTQVDTVQPGQVGQYEGKYPGGLINPDRTMYAPRFGMAWSPRFAPRVTKQMIVRAGYGINYNTGQFATMAKSLSYQPPFAATQTNTVTTSSASSATGCVTTTTNATANMTLAHGFGCSTGEAIQDNYAVDKNYRLGMVQTYNVNIQRTVAWNIVLNVGYNGSKGSNLDVLGSPNGTPLGVSTPGVAPYDFEESAAALHSNQLVLSAQMRQQQGNALGVTYVYSHSIDNASGVAGAAGTPVQNFFNLAAEEGNSSFDQRHNLRGNWLLQLPFGPNRRFLNKGGLVSRMVDGYSLSGTFTFATGNYFTPQYSGNAAEASSGNVYQQRPNRDFTQPLKGPGRVREFFNTAAFTAPVVNGVTQYGTASPGSIEGPGTVAVDASLSRTFELGGTRSMEARVTASNVFNTVQYSGINTTENSANFGEVTSAATMRTILVQARYRF